MKSILKSSVGTTYVLTCDQLNGQHFIEVASIHNLHVEVLFPAQMPLPDDAVALFIDQDGLCLNAHERRLLLEGFKTIPPRVPTAVFGYDADSNSEAKNLVIGRRFDDVLLRRLLALLGGDVETNSAPNRPLSEGLNEDELALMRLADDGGPHHGD